jgi:acyl transferase domain-containing protein
VSSFGVGGTNAHLVLEQVDEPTPVAGADGRQLLVLSARDEDRLRAYAARLAGFLEAHGHEVGLGDVAHTLRVGRDEHEQRLALCVDDPRAAALALRAFAQGEPAVGLQTGKVAAGADEAEVEAALSGVDPEALARLWVSGAVVDWQRLPGAAQARRVSLPTYPFARVRHWVQPAAS